MMDLVVEDLEDLDFALQPPDEDQLSILDFPDEILLQIFSYISLHELYRSVATVCKLFLRLTRDPAVRSSIFISNKVNQIFAIDFLAESVYTNRLVLKERSDSNVLLQTAFATFHHLNHLELRFCRQINHETFELMANPNIAENLKFLSFDCTDSCTRDPSNQTSSRVSLFSHASNLRHLNLFASKFPESEDLITIGKVCKHLEYLNLEEVTNLSGSSLTSLILDRKETLKTLMLDGEDLTDETFKHLEKCKKLEKLGILFAEHISTQGMEAISKLSQLKSLKLMRAKVLPPIEFIATFSSPKLERLTSLNLSESSLLDDPSISTIANTCRFLKELLLNWCWELTDKGVEDVIMYCDRLEILSLVGVVRITDGILDNIGNRLPDLRLLDLEQCPNIDDKHVVEIVAETNRSNLKVINYWGEPLTKAGTNSP